MENHARNQATGADEMWLKEVLSGDDVVDSSTPAKGAMSWVRQTLFISFLEKAERTIGIQALRLALAMSLKTEHLVRLLWSHVNLESGVVFVPYYPRSYKNTLFTCQKLTEVGKSILLELHANRKEGEERVLPGTTEKGMRSELHANLRRILKRLNLPYVGLEHLVRLGQLKQMIEGGDSRPALPGQMMFREAPWSIGKKVLRRALSEMPGCDWPQDSEAYLVSDQNNWWKHCPL